MYTLSADVVALLSGAVRRGIARALYVSSLADHRDEPELACPCEGPKAGPGEDWMDLAGETPAEFETHAQTLCSKFAKLNEGQTPYEVLEKAARADGMLLAEDTQSEDYAEEFDLCLALQSLGTGVAWADDHDFKDFRAPSVTCLLFACEDCGGLDCYFSEE